MGGGSPRRLLGRGRLGECGSSGCDEQHRPETGGGKVLWRRSSASRGLTTRWEAVGSFPLVGTLVRLSQKNQILVAIVIFFGLVASLFAAVSVRCFIARTLTAWV